VLQAVRGVPLTLVSHAQLAAAPPVYYLPDANGFAVPPDCTRWSIDCDISQIPNLSELDLAVEYRYFGQSAGSPWQVDCGTTWQVPSGGLGLLGDGGARRSWASLSSTIKFAREHPRRGMPNPLPASLPPFVPNPHALDWRNAPPDLCRVRFDRTGASVVTLTITGF
jgi:hypothetical protein